MEKTFGELSREEKLALLTAWVDGKQIQIRYRSNTWVTLEHIPMWNSVTCYRIAPVTPITFDWSHLKSEYKYVAKDECGAVYAYTVQPFYDSNVRMGSAFWRSGSNFSVQIDKVIKIDKGTVLAKDSLIVRPE